MISHKHKFVFIGIPKSATSSLKASLGKFSDVSFGTRKAFPSGKYRWHTTAKKLKGDFMEVGQNWDEYFKFAFVRNPWDRCVSAFYYNNSRGDGSSYYRNYIKQYNGNFKEYIKTGHWPSMIHMKPQTEFLHDSLGNSLVDFIGRFENLQEDFNVVCDKIGIPRQALPHKKKTEKRHYTEYYDDEVKQIVEERYATDIDCFGHTFGE